MNEIVERMAAAMEQSYKGRHWDLEAMAGAALMALREPTAAMKRVGADFAGNSQDGFTAIWQAVIDEALGVHRSP